MKMKTKAKIASVLGFIVVVLYSNDKADIKTVGKYATYAFFIVMPLFVLIKKYQSKLDRVFTKGVNVLLMVSCLLLWRWLHSVSFALESILAFIVSFTVVFLSFTLDDIYFESLTKK